jgi:hypothetical protein
MSFLDAMIPAPTVPLGFTHLARPLCTVACGAPWPGPKQTAPFASVFRQNVTCPACLAWCDKAGVWAGPQDPWMHVHRATWPQQVR